MADEQKPSGLIYSAMAKILEEVAPLAKEKTNDGEGGYKYRGIDDLYNHVQPLFAKHKVFNTAEVLERHAEPMKTNNGKNMLWNKVTIRYWFHASDGSKVSSDGIAEGWSASDKGSSKAMAQCHKYAIFQLLMLPTNDMTDSDEGEQGGGQQQNWNGTPPNQGGQQIWNGPGAHQQYSQAPQQQYQQAPPPPAAAPPPAAPAPSPAPIAPAPQVPGTKIYAGWGSVDADADMSTKYRLAILIHLKKAATDADVRKIFSNLKGNHKTLTPTDYAICKDACSDRIAEVTPATTDETPAAAAAETTEETTT